jgi:hypothetical protein
MMPKIPLDYRTDKDKVSSAIFALQFSFYLSVVHHKKTVIIERVCPRYEKNDNGTIDEVHDEMAISATSFRLMFECNGISGRFRLNDLTEDAFKTLLSAKEYPQKFNVYLKTVSGKKKICSLSDII